MFQEKDMSVGAWLVFYILSAIPFVNIIVWLVLLLGSKTNKSLKNLLVLQVILVAIMIGFMILFWGTLVASLPTA